MLVDYLSDLHLEFHSKYPLLPKSSAEILVLAGDIGYPSHKNWIDFLHYCKTQYKYVLYVAGNHEYYSRKKTYAAINQLIAESCARLGIIFLDNKSWIKDGVKFTGTTLWSHIPDESAHIVGTIINDYVMIQKEVKISDTGRPCYTPVTVNDTNQMNKTASDFLIEELKCAETAVVITHHVPLYCRELVPERYRGDPCWSAFNNHTIDSLVDSADYWIFGHSHQEFTYKHGKCQLVSNPYDYPLRKNEFPHLKLRQIKVV